MTERRAAKGRGTVVALPNGKFRGQADFGIINGRRQRPVTASAPTEKAANALLKKLIEKGPNRQVVATLTVGEWMAYWLDNIATQRLRADTLDGYRSKIRVHIIPTIGDVRLHLLTPEHLEQLYAGMREAGSAQATIRQVHAIIRRALVVAERRGRIDENPAKVIELGAAPPNPHQQHTTDENLRILDQARTIRESARLHVALSVGLRQSEALALDWDDIHETDPSPWLYVHRTAQKGVILEATKTAKSRRPVYLSRATASILAAWRSESGGIGLVFPGRDGHPLTPKPDARVWHEAEDRAGLPRYPLHGARGALVSHMSEQGVPLEVAAEILGHSSTTTTRRHYLVMGSAQQLAAIQALERGRA